MSAHGFDSLGEDFEKKEDELFGDDGFEKVVDKVATIEKKLGIYELAQFPQKSDYAPSFLNPGRLTSKHRKWVNAEFGYIVTLWDVDPIDWKEPGPAVVARRIISQAKPGSIILSHDIHAQTIAAMPETLDALLGKGFKFVTVSELLSLAQTALPASPSPSATMTPTKR